MTEPTKEDLDLNFYEGVRKDIVTKLTAEKDILNDTERANLLLKAVDGGSRTALAKKRLAVDQEAVASQAQTMELFANLLTNTPTARQRMERGETRAPLAEIDATPPIAGETDIGTKEVLYDNIMAGEKPQ